MIVPAEIVRAVGIVDAADGLGEAVVAEAAVAVADVRVEAVVVAAADAVPAADTVGRATRVVPPILHGLKRKSRDESCGSFLVLAKLFQDARTATRLVPSKICSQPCFLTRVC